MLGFYFRLMFLIVTTCSQRVVILVLLDCWELRNNQAQDLSGDQGLKIMTAATNLSIRFDQLKCADLWVKSRGNSFNAYVVENMYPNGFVEYGAWKEELDRVIGKTVYFTDTSGATSSTRYLGFCQVTVSDVPEWVTA